MVNPLEAMRQNINSVANLAIQAMSQYGITKADGLWSYSKGPLLSLRSSERVPLASGSVIGYGNIWMSARLSHDAAEAQNKDLAAVKKFIASVLVNSGYYGVRSAWKVRGFQISKEVYDEVDITVSFKVNAEVPCNYRLEWALN